MPAVTSAARRAAFLLVIVPCALVASLCEVLASVAWFAAWLATGNDLDRLFDAGLEPLVWAFRILPEHRPR